MNKIWATTLLTIALSVLPICAFGVNGSDCTTGKVDSTCGASVRSTTNPPADPTLLLYDGQLGTGPYVGNEYWGFDFAAAAAGVRDDLITTRFVNRSFLPLTLVFYSPVPDTCRGACVPGYEFKLGFKSQYPKIIQKNGIASATFVVPGGQQFGWIIGQKRSPAIFVRATVPALVNSQTTLSDVGLPEDLALTNSIPPQILTCQCWDTSLAQCSAGTRFSNGLIGLWQKFSDGASAPDAFNDCPPER